MPTMRSMRCCNKGLSFGTVSVLLHQSEIHVILQGEPCCEKEFHSFLSILGQMYEQLPSTGPIYLLYNLTRCKQFKRSQMTAQERVLSRVTASAIIVKNPILRGAIKLATTKGKSETYICDTLSDGLRWLKKVRDRNLELTL